MSGLRMAEPQAKRAPVFGISEWQNFYRGDEPGCDDPAIIDECVDVHRAVGMDGIVWNAGRGTILYQSELSHTTVQCSLGLVPKAARVSGEYMLKVLEQVCPLARAVELGTECDMPIMGRLSMNRFYGGGKNIDSTSRFYLAHPEWVDVGKLVEPIGSRLCYAIEGVQQERLDILLEIQRKGVNALLLDFCRQMPIIGYHEAVVTPFQAQTGVDPRTIDTDNPDDYREWFQYRCDILTGFMRKLRVAVRDQEKTLGRPCQIVARIPDNAPWLMHASSLDTEAWCAEDLIDGAMLSPFPRLRDDLGSYPEYHVDVAHRYGKFCIGGVGSNRLLPRFGLVPGPGDLPYACLVADRQYKAGVDGMSLYQSEQLCRSELLQTFISRLGDKAWIADQCAGLTHPKPEEDAFFVGKDWHSHYVDEGLGTKICGNNAL